MNYIVFDLEWNQCPYGKQRENPRLPFEIIEIGAVKLNERKEFLDTFRALIRPVVYGRLHFQTMKVVGLTNADLKTGVPFAEAAESFLKWCGSDCRFCTWGSLDLMELQRNLAFFGMRDRLRGPIIYEDVQKLFAIAYETRSVRRALSYAVDYLKLPEEGGFHFAKADAVYTAKVLQQIPDEVIEKNYSIDCFQNPKTREDEIFLRFDTYEKFISREFDSKEALMADPEISAVRCFVCHRNVCRLVRWFSDGSGRNHLAVGRCPEHGLVKSKIRVREAEDGNFFAIRTTRQISEEELTAIRKKQTFLRVKRRSRRRK